MLSRICPNCACSQLFLVPYSFFVFRCSKRCLFWCKHCSKGSQVPACLAWTHMQRGLSVAPRMALPVPACPRCCWLCFTVITMRLTHQQARGTSSPHSFAAAPCLSLRGKSREWLTEACPPLCPGRAGASQCLAGTNTSADTGWDVEGGRGKCSYECLLRPPNGFTRLYPDKAMSGEGPGQGLGVLRPTFLLQTSVSTGPWWFAGSQVW